VLGNLENETATLGLGLALGELDVEGVEDSGELVTVELNVDDGTNDGLDLTDLVASGGSVRAGSLDWTLLVKLGSTFFHLPRVCSDGAKKTSIFVRCRLFARALPPEHTPRP